MQIKFKNNNEMDLYIFASDKELGSKVNYFGTQDCNPSQQWGPVVRDHYLLHYIIDGSGIFELDNKTYTLQKNQGFLIPPNIPSTYQANELTPWKYAWVGFSGLKSEYYLANTDSTINNPIFTCENGFINDCLYQMQTACNLKSAVHIRLSALLQMLLSEFIEESNNSSLAHSDYTRKAIHYIHQNYDKDISVHEIADYLCLNRSYFSMIFKDELNLSPKQYITNYKISKACEMLNNTNLSIQEIAYSVGFNDPLYFSRAFKEAKGCSPKKYKLSNLK